MKRVEDKRKSVALSFVGFEITPLEIAALLGVEVTSSGVEGEPIKPKHEKLWKSSYAEFELFMPSDVRLADMLPEFFKYLGGVEHLCIVRDQVKPQSLIINIVLPIKGSETQEGGYFELSDLSDLNKLGVTLAFEFL